MSLVYKVQIIRYQTTISFQLLWLITRGPKGIQMVWYWSEYPGNSLHHNRKAQIPSSGSVRFRLKARLLIMTQKEKHNNKQDKTQQRVVRLVSSFDYLSYTVLNFISSVQCIQWLVVRVSQA